jgi:hypothetical protein
MMYDFYLLTSLLLAPLTILCAADMQPASHLNAVDVPAVGKLPRIRVDAANKGFVDANGERFVPCGVSYYRPGTGWALSCGSSSTLRPRGRTSSA